MPQSHVRQNQHVIWARCSSPNQIEQVAELEQTLRQDGDRVQFLCSLPDPRDEGVLKTPTTQRNTRQFIFAHRPIAVLWVGGLLDQNILAPCHAVDLPIVVLEGSASMLDGPARGWLPGRGRSHLAKLHAVFLKDMRDRSAFVQAGVPDHVIQIAGSLGDSSTVLPYRESDRRELAEVLGTRPVWLAAETQPEDVEMLCQAHREAARRAHRLLLIIAPTQPGSGRAIADTCRAAGLNTSLRSAGAEPEESTQVYLADDDDSMGLWYRIAPITFLGGTFNSGARDDPFHPAALGSVTIHGPAQGKYQERFRKLMSVDATLQIMTPAALGEAVAQLLSVDKAAAKANAGWDITSRGAATAALVSAILQHLIDGEAP
ncbi:3-deoxy-D-manno-octulosonic-acid transferase [Cognatiyoonia koreensis]|uniref:3-deoxy-D-manno-octulosonic acid transferase n=1 Tax=Cognatiyoonia koreensis TaxID=364200 RepID=A0A1I0RUB8_9RHOB|nr:hypothetical protein [Cognatiyoonia koreensis]SEW44950.1 3-deoxy-D-manno-octulosonic-acid transferase [Cognatiyoonia koreensis]